MTPASSAGTQKVSMFAAKAGFVIPKNKLSGSLVPVFRGSKNLGAVDAVSGESKKRIQRKTKWGPDLTQDASVKKGRALAYQTRVEQITQQLESEMLEDENDEDLLSAPQDPHHRSSKHQIDTKDVDQLELEKREAIGVFDSFLRLYLSHFHKKVYQTLYWFYFTAAYSHSTAAYSHSSFFSKHSNTKPALSIAFLGWLFAIPVLVKEYPKYNLVDLIYGPESDNQKQLEKETGAKIQVYGTKAGTGQKAEIKPSDGSEIHGEYEILYVHVSVDTFEKVDAAVAVIELLVTSVSHCSFNYFHIGKSGSGNGTTTARTCTNSTGWAVSVPWSISLEGPIFPPLYMPGFTLNSLRPILNNPSHLSTSLFNPAYLPSSFGLPPSLVSPRQNPPTPQFLPHTYMASQPASAPQPGVASMPPPSNISTANMVSSVNPPIAAPSFISIPLPRAGIPSTSLSTSLQARVPSSVSGSVPNFAPLKPPMMTAQSPGDFTFQPHRPQNPSFQTVPQPSSHFSVHNASLARPMLPSPAPQAPSARQSVPPRLATFLESSTVLPWTPHPPIRPSNFNPPHQMPNLPGPLPPRPGNYIQIQQNYPAHATRPEIPRAPNQQFSNHLAFSSGKSASGPGGGQQLYDPFSPTSANQQQGGNPGKM
uniref:T1.4 protein n=1 Tax=Malus x robusta TaxID=1184610 RepID=I7K8K0_9ROSA|nr:T1.4 [Malus x robusta]